MFEKSLQDLIKGIRNHKRDASTYISKAVVEVKKELKSTDPYVKFVAIQKVTYLQMLGVDVGFATFHVVEVMSSGKFAYKKAGMLAANQIFDVNTDVLLLCTNLLKKQLHDSNLHEVGIALNCLSNISNRELARDLLEDVASLLNSSRPYIRKKAVLTLYKLYLKYPQGLPQTFDRLRQRLDDPDMSVVSCTVNVICELSRKNPRNFLALAPQLFHLLTTSTNNWMLIKIVKLMCALVPEEPRLARKLIEPLAKVVETTQAKSLLYECIHSVTLCLAYTSRTDGSQPKAVPAIVTLCTVKLREFVEDPDQNLKYLGLVGLVNLMRSHPRVVAEHKELVLKCLLDEDLTVRMRALELLTGMVTKRTLMDIVQKLLHHVQTAEGSYRDELIEKIIYVCSRDKYAYLSNFAWYISVLVELSHIHGCPRGQVIREQLVDISVRVPTVRAFAVDAMLNLLMDRRLARVGTPEEGVSHILFAACWICCEFADLINRPLNPGDANMSGNIGSSPSNDHTGHPSETSKLMEKLVVTMLAPQTCNLHAFVQAAFVHNAMKLVYASAKRELEYESSDLEDGDKRLASLAQTIGSNLERFAVSEFIQVQDRAVMHIQLLQYLNLYNPTVANANKEDLLLGTTMNGGESDNDNGENKTKMERIVETLSCLFAEELAAVGAQAQSLVPIPKGLQLERPLDGLVKGAVENDAHFEDILAKLESGKANGGILRVSFRDPMTSRQSDAHKHLYGSDSGSSSSSDENEDEDLMLMSSSSSSSRKNKKNKSKRKTKKKDSKKKHNNKTSDPKHRANDPYYIRSGFSSEASSTVETDEGVPDVVHLENGALGASIRSGESDDLMMMGSSTTTISDLYAKSRYQQEQDDIHFKIITDEVMPEGTEEAILQKQQWKKLKEQKPANEEDITLADIDLMSAVDAKTPQMNKEVEDHQNDKHHKKDKKKKHKESKKKKDNESDGVKKQKKSKKEKKSKSKKDKE